MEVFCDSVKGALPLLMFTSPAKPEWEKKNTNIKDNMEGLVSPRNLFSGRKFSKGSCKDRGKEESRVHLRKDADLCQRKDSL